MAKLDGLRLKLAFGINDDESSLMFDTKVEDSEIMLSSFRHPMTLHLGLSAPKDMLPVSGFSMEHLLYAVGMSELDLFLEPQTILQLARRAKDDTSTLSPPLSGIWFKPSMNKTTTLRICAEELQANSSGRLIGLKHDIPGCKFSDCYMTVTKQGHYGLQVSSLLLLLLIQCREIEIADAMQPAKAPAPANHYAVYHHMFAISSTVKLGEMICDAYVYINDDISLTFQWHDPDATIVSLMDWIGKSSGMPDGTNTAFDDFTEIVGDILGGIQLREVSLSASFSGGWKITPSFKVTLEVDLGEKWGVASNAKVPVMLVFEYRRSASGSKPYFGFKGRLWPRVTSGMLRADRMDPDSPPAPRLQPSLKLVGAVPQYYISLTDLLAANSATNVPGPNVDKLKGIVPTYITALSFEISNTRVAFAGTMKASVEDDNKVVQKTDATRQAAAAEKTEISSFLIFDEVKIDAAYTFGAQTKSLDFGFDAVMFLDPRPREVPKGATKPVAPYRARLEVSSSRPYLLLH